MTRHWTTSEHKGGSEFFVTDLWTQWIEAYRKLRYNETNWITNSDGLFSGFGKTAGNSSYSSVPFMSTTNKVGVIIVDISKSSTTPLKQVRLTAYDPDTGGPLTITRTEVISTTSKKLSKEYSGKKQYLSYTYCIITYTPSTAYVNESGVPISKRVNLRVQIDNSGWEELAAVGKKTYMKFFEIGPDALTGGNIYPFTNEPIPNYFLSSFFGLATGDLYDESVGKRYLNYIIPTTLITTDVDKVYTSINLREDSILAYIIKMNNSVSYKEGSVYYNAMKLISLNTIQNALQRYKLITEFDEETEEDYYSTELKVNYTNWKEYNLVGWEALAGVFNPNDSVKLKELLTVAALGSCFNVASASMLPGYEETSLNDIFELCLPTVTTAHQPPIDNVTMSIIANTFKLPFWKFKHIDEVLVFRGVINTQAGGDTGDPSYTLGFETRPSNGFFQMVLELEDTGVCDIVEAGLGFYCKFYV